MILKKEIKLVSAHPPVNALIISAAVIVLDQFTKYLVLRNMDLFESINLLPFLSLTLLHNTGAAFSLLADASGWQRWFFIILGVSVSGGILWWLRRLPETGQRLLSISLALILGGALGNVIDRTLHGHVIDFIQFFLGSWSWPAFNIADSAISIGAVLLIYDGFLGSGKENADSKSTPEDIP